MEQDDQERDDEVTRQLKEAYESGFQAGVEKGRQWLPESIDLFVHECALALGNCSTIVPGDDGEPCPWPSSEDLQRTLQQPVPWPLATLIAELCRGIFVEPPPLVTQALEEGDESPFASPTNAHTD